VGTPDELLDRILDAAAGIKKREDKLRHATRDLRTRVAKRTEVDDRIFRAFPLNSNIICFLSVKFFKINYNLNIINTKQFSSRPLTVILYLYIHTALTR